MNLCMTSKIEPGPVEKTAMWPQEVNALMSAEPLKKYDLKKNNIYQMFYVVRH